MHSSVRHSSDEGVLGEAVFAEQEQHSLALFSEVELAFLASLIPSLEIIFAADAIVVVVLIFIWLFLIDFASTPLVVDISMIMANNTNINTHHKNKEILS